MIIALTEKLIKCAFVPDFSSAKVAVFILDGCCTQRKNSFVIVFWQKL